MRELRETIWALDKECLSLESLQGRLKGLAARSCRNGISCVVLGNEGPDVPLTPIQGLNLYRIAQEAVTNAIKHSRGDRIEIVLATSESELVLQVTDNGLSSTQDDTFSHEAGGDLSGHGMANMRSRAHEMAGHFDWGRSASGTTVTVRIPL